MRNSFAIASRTLTIVTSLVMLAGVLSVAQTVSANAPGPPPNPLGMYLWGENCYSSCSYGLFALTPQDWGITLIGPGTLYSGYCCTKASIAVGGHRLFTNDGYLQVTEYALGQKRPIASLSDSGVVMAANGSDTLYIAHSFGINVYPAGSTKPSRTIKNGVLNVATMAVGPQNDLYVSNWTEVVVYHPNGSKPARRITQGISGASQLRFDTTGQLLVLNSTADDITIYPVGGNVPKMTIPNLKDPCWETVGPTDTVYVVSCSRPSVQEYDNESSVLSREINAIHHPFFAEPDIDDNLYVIDDGSVSYIFKFLPKHTKHPTRRRIPFSLSPMAYQVGTAW